MCVCVCVCVCVCRSSDKGHKLQEAWEQQQFLHAVEDIEVWIVDMENQMASEDLGRDLTSVNNLLKKHAVGAPPPPP